MIVPEILIAKCIKNNRRAQNQLFDLLAPYLAAVCRRYLTNQGLFDDCMQESFLSIFKNIKQFDPSRASFVTWAVRVAINVCIKAEMKERKHFSTEMKDVIEPLQNPRIFSQLDLADVTEKMKYHMPRSHFEAFNMHVVDGFSYEEIALDLNISRELVRQRVARARKWIKENLKTDNKLQLNK